VTLPETRYARNNGLHVAYQLVGDGPVDVVLLTQWFFAPSWTRAGSTGPCWSPTWPPASRFTRAADYPWGFDAGNFDMVMERTRRTWGKGLLLRQFAPSLLADAALVELESRYERQAASPGTAMAMTRMINLIDVRSVLPTITVRRC